MTEKMIYLTDVIAPAFYSVHRDMAEQKYIHYWLRGGRGSGKSSFAALEIILGMMRSENANAVVLRKVAVNLRDSVFEQLRWAIGRLGLEDHWESRLSPMELIRRQTGQKILFRGADDPRKIKSIRFLNGYAKYVWYEEADEFAGVEEIATINQSLLRGGEEFCVCYTYNPPILRENWINQEVQKVREDSLFHSSTYLQMPRQWLGETFFQEAEYVKRQNPERYRHTYLGEAIGSGGEIFRNLSIRKITQREIDSFEHIARGLDWGYAADPLHYTVNHYDSRKRKLYIFGEIRGCGISNREITRRIKAENRENGTVVADSAEPKSIAELCEAGLHVIPAKKGRDSVAYGMKWLRDLEEIVIDPNRCPFTAKEFMGYAFLQDKEGGWRAEYPDRNNHSIDAVRYSRQDDMRQVFVR